MSLSLHALSVGTFNRMLGVLDKILVKAEAHAQAKGFDPGNLLKMRLTPDMLDLTRQVQIACDQAKAGAARLAGVEVPRHEDTETSIPELRARIAKVLDFVNSLDRAAIDDGSEREIVLTMQGKELRFVGNDYVVVWMLPNFYFHLTTAYDLLRHSGVEIGKRDFLGGA